MDWGQIQGALRRRKLFMLVVVLLGSGLGILIGQTMEPTYVTEARFWIDEPVSTDGPELGPIQSGRLLEATAWMELLRSYRVLDAVVREHRLHVEPASNVDPEMFETFRSEAVNGEIVPGRYIVEMAPSGETVRLLSDGAVVDSVAAGEEIGAERGFGWTPPEGALQPGERVEFAVRSVRQASGALAEELASAMDLNGNFLRVGLSGSDPVRITEVLNGVAERFVTLAGELKSSGLSERTAILEEQLAAARERLESSESSLEAFRSQAIVLPGEVGGESGGEGGSSIRDAYFELELERDNLVRTREALQSALAMADGERFPIETLEATPLAASSTEISMLLEELAARRAELRALRNRYSDEHPDVQGTLGAVRNLETQAVPDAVQRLDADLERRIAGLNGQLQNRSGTLSAIPTRVREEARQSRDVELAEALYTTLQQRYEEARLAEASSIPDVRILDMAAVPALPESNDGPRMMLLGILGSLALAVGGAIVVDRSDRRVRDPAEITQGMGLNILGAIPKVKGRRDATSRRMAMEAFRSLSVNLTHSYGSAGPMILSVTSPDLGDGKSFVTVNLAGTLARQGYRTVIVDGDTRRGVVHQLLGKDRRPGLTDHLAGDVEIEQIIQTIIPDSLDIIPSGTRRESGPELLTSPIAGELFSRLKSEYEIVLVDTPPLKAGADAMILSTLTGHMLFVLRTGVTARGLAESNLEQLDRLPVRVLGAVLNDISSEAKNFQAYTYASSYGAMEESDATPRLAGAGGPSGSR